MKKLLMIVVFLFLVSSISSRLLAQTEAEPEVFNVTDYENINPDILNVYGLDTADATGHWLNWVLPGEGRRASLIFHAKYYLQTYSDLQPAFRPTGYHAAARLFITTRSPSGVQHAI